MSNWRKESPKAKTIAGIPIITIKAENTTLAPYLSIKVPTIILAGIVRATLQMANIFMCSLVSHPTLLSMVVARGAILNQT